MEYIMLQKPCTTGKMAHCTLNMHLDYFKMKIWLVWNNQVKVSNGVKWDEIKKWYCDN